MAAWADMEFIAATSARYHRRRAAFLERVSRLISAAILVGGAAAFVGVVGEANVFAKVVSAGIVLAGVIQIVFQTDRCAETHKQWLRAWNEMLAEIQQNENPPPELINEWLRRKYEIESDCSAEMRALVNDSYNRTMNALGRQGDPYKITRWQRLWMQIISFENASYK
jgi:hypothetical protein